MKSGRLIRPLTGRSPASLGPRCATLQQPLSPRRNSTHLTQSPQWAGVRVFIECVERGAGWSRLCRPSQLERRLAANTSGMHRISQVHLRMATRSVKSTGFWYKLWHRHNFLVWSDEYSSADTRRTTLSQNRMFMLLRPKEQSKGSFAKIRII